MPINRSRLVAALAALPLLGLALPAAADSPWQGDRGHAPYAFPGRGVVPVPADTSWHGQGGSGRGGPERWDHGRPGWGAPIQRGRHVVVVPAPRIRHYRNVVVVRPHGHIYPGYGHFRSDDDAYKWLAFTAITLKVLDSLDQAQERALEAAQVRATAAPLGEGIIWHQGGASGSVTAVREGTSTLGRYCREFQQNVSIGGQTERAYGTACQQPDGAWEVVATGD
jgi:17 kDa outer membrane surface antigen